ncbi:MAG TPA: hypothetical protein VFG05_12575 [Methylocella sp.]|nr:hypothetical protein [Methylocella sp.]
MKTKILLLMAASVAIAAIGLVIAWPGPARAIFDDFTTWFRYFAGPIRRG